MKEALKLALDYIVATNKSSEFWLIPASNLNKTVTAIKEALAQPEQDSGKTAPPKEWGEVSRDELIKRELEIVKRIAKEEKALAQPEQEPVAWVYPEGLEALKAGKPWTAYGTRQEPNNTALYLSPQPDIPPYAWVTFTPYGDEDDVWYENPEGQLLEGWTYKPLYDTTPPQRTWVGLTDEELELLNNCGDTDSYKFAKSIEAKLKEKNT